MAITKDDQLAALMASVPTRAVTGPESPTRVDIPAASVAPVLRPSSQDIRASVPELVDLGTRIARIESLLDDSRIERMRRQARDEVEAERRKLMSEEAERQRHESERKARDVGRWVAITTALLTTLGTVAVQVFNAAQGAK